MFRGSTHQGSASPNALASYALLQLLRNPHVHSGPLLELFVLHTLPLLDYTSWAGCPFDQIWNVVDRLFAEISDFTFVIDALDECQSSDNCSQLLRRLRETAALPGVRIIVTSRFREVYEANLKAANHIVMDSSCVSEDIVNYTNRVLSRTQSLHALRSEILEKVQSDAGGMFLWVKMMLDYLQTATTLNAAKRELTKFPRGLSAIYEKFLSEKDHSSDPEKLSLRRQLFMLLVASAEPLTAEDLSFSLALRAPHAESSGNDLLDPDRTIHELCWPFISIRNGKVELIHMSVKQFFLRATSLSIGQSLAFSYQECHTFLAQKCLYALLQVDLGSISRIKVLLESSFRETASSEDQDGASLQTLRPFLAYANHFWNTHIIQAGPNEPNTDLLSAFLESLNFVSWSETLCLCREDLNPILEVRSLLESWFMTLSRDQQANFRLQNYFVSSYDKLYQQVRMQHPETPLQFLVLQRLAAFYNHAGKTTQSRDGLELRAEIAAGFNSMLGPTHRSTLKGQTEHGIELMIQGQYSKAEKLLVRTSQLQAEHIGLDVSDSFRSQEYAALTMFYQRRFASAEEYQQLASEGLLRTVGPRSREFLISRLFLGRAIEANGRIEAALSIYKDIWELWILLQGRENGVALHMQHSMAIAYWKLKLLDSAKTHFTEVLTHRQRLFGCQNTVSIDTAFNLAIVFYEQELLDSAEAYLALTESNGVQAVEFERLCQKQHIRALIEVKRGRWDMAANMLREVIHDSRIQERPFCRELVWIRLSLATIYRRNERREKVESLFFDLVCPTIGGNGELEGSVTGTQLRATERAARCAKADDFAAADRVLSSVCVEWRDQTMFWGPSSGPAADTSLVTLCDESWSA